ncbi:galactose-1-phosphate uridylyltransferase [Glycomyces sp. L485]|uniref:galactose-1-phosphate uridylyltransferase n=1 Tax=Glycomyces sp. L485 TaxID=2909235 RepID=UPI001F4B15F1|nr:galactose-1-phosphate uridylyltransferase [Glycomyces sp. L485]
MTSRAGRTGPDNAELRQDPFTRAWAVIAPERERRPHPVPDSTPARGARPVTLDPKCPFCPGNEDQTPAELWRLPTDDGDGWTVRVVPNRFPVLAAADRPALHHRDGLLVSADGVGAHEVVIETPRHDLDLADADDAAVAAVLGAYRARARALRGIRPGLVLPFRNHGAAAGTSLSHPHSQIVATPIVPLRYRQLFDIARAHYDDHGSCLYADVTTAELAEGARVLAVADHVVALAPYASRVPFEARLVPRVHQASFADVADEVLTDASALLRGLLVALRDLLGDFSYNFVLVSAPNGEEHTDYFSWHLSLLPRLVIAAGFELGTGIAVNPLPPERAAARLRRALSERAANQER